MIFTTLLSLLFCYLTYRALKAGGRYSYWTLATIPLTLVFTVASLALFTGSEDNRLTWLAAVITLGLSGVALWLAALTQQSSD